MCQDSLSAFTGSDAVEDGLVVLGDALEADPDDAGVNVGQPSSPLEQKHKYQSLNLMEILGDFTLKSRFRMGASEMQFDS